MSKLKERGNANGVVLPQESVQQLQEINQYEYQERMKKAQETQHIKTTTANTSGVTSTNDSAQLLNGISPPESKKSANTFIRPRPTPSADPSPFTRHMSLPYRSRPMGHPGFNQKGSSTYQALTDDLPPPRLQADSSSIESARLHPATQANSPHSQADMWLATASSSQNQGLLVTTTPNPFSTGSVTTTASATIGSAGWNQNNAAANSAEPTPNPFGSDSFESNWSQAGTQSTQANPFSVDFSNRKEQFV